VSQTRSGVQASVVVVGVVVFHSVMRTANLEASFGCCVMTVFHVAQSPALDKARPPGRKATRSGEKKARAKCSMLKEAGHVRHLCNPRIESHIPLS